MFRAVSLSSFMTLPFLFFAAVPTSETYTMPGYTFGNGGGSGNDSSHRLDSSVGGQGNILTSTTYVLPAGIRASLTASAPAAPNFTNPDSSYDRLKIVLNTAGQASDTTYAVAISDDDFVSTSYVQPDLTIGSTYVRANFQTYASWGGAGGVWVQGLEHDTTYKVKVAALQGSGTGSAFGPTATAATLAPSVTFGVSTSLSPTPPFSAGFTSLPPGIVTSANATITNTISTNARQGGVLQLNSLNAGLTSNSMSYTIPSATADLTVATSGYGAQVTTAIQDSGGPLAAVGPYDGTGNNVGGLTSALATFASFNAPITNGSVTYTLLAKSNAAAPAANDYTDTLSVTFLLSF